MSSAGSALRPISQPTGAAQTGAQLSRWTRAFPAVAGIPTWLNAIATPVAAMMTVSERLRSMSSSASVSPRPRGAPHHLVGGQPRHREYPGQNRGERDAVEAAWVRATLEPRSTDLQEISRIPPVNGPTEAVSVVRVRVAASAAPVPRTDHPVHDGK